MNLKLSNTKAIALAAGMLAGVALSAPGAEAGMRIHFGFPIGSFHARGGHHHHHHAHKYHHRRLKALRRAKAIEAARRREAAAEAAAARAAKKRAAAVAAAAEAKRKAAAVAAAEAKRKAAAEQAAAEQQKLEAARKAELAAVPLPVKKSDAPIESLKTAAVTTTDSNQTGGEPAKLECKRYFANVGMTISVPCTE